MPRRTLKNTVPLNLRVSKESKDAFEDAHYRLKEWVPKAVLMDRAIKLLVADLTKRKELTNG